MILIIFAHVKNNIKTCFLNLGRFLHFLDAREWLEAYFKQGNLLQYEERYHTLEATIHLLTITFVHVIVSNL